MKKRGSLDYDGLDGILQQSDKPQLKPAWVKSLWTIPVIIALAVSVFLLQKLSQTPLSTKTTSAQNFPSKASEQTSNPAPLISKQVLTTSHENSKIKETPVLPDTKISAVLTPENVRLKEPPPNVTPVNEGQTIAHSKAQVIPTLPAKTPLISGDDKAKPSTDAIFTVYFKFYSSKIPLLSKTETKKLIHFAQRCQNLISITGHTCNLGTDSANQLLGWARANALKKLLITHDIRVQRIVTASKGMRKPAESNDTLSGRASNRRAELYCLEP
jgi:OmpA-OmpF porin, OOP family